MPRLSFWKEGKHSNDYKFFDRHILEMFTVGGTGVNLHKYIGSGTDQSSIAVTIVGEYPENTDTIQISDSSACAVGMYIDSEFFPKNTKILCKFENTIVLDTESSTLPIDGAKVVFYSDASQPEYLNITDKNIQDLLFLENRDRKYDKDIYTLRAIYNVSDQDFDLSQFGIFLAAGSLFMVFHLNNMVETIGRKVMNGDVIELIHLKDFHSLDEDLPAALKRYYVVTDAARASEGFSVTWWSHLWRVKLEPLVDKQEYKDILNTIAEENDQNIQDLMSTYKKYIEINDAIIRQAENDVPLSGYDTSVLYIKGLKDNGMPEDPFNWTADQSIALNQSALTADQLVQTPDKSISGYLTGDGIAPNMHEVKSGVSFPTRPRFGDYFLRTDFMPQRLFRFNGTKWAKVEDVVRTPLTPGESSKTLKSTFINNKNTFVTSTGKEVSERQTLDEIFKIKPDR